MSGLVALMELFERLHDHWERQRVPLARHLIRPGASAARIAEVGAQTVGEIPADLAAWWRWADLEPPSERRVPGLAIGPGLMYLSLNQALRDYRRWRETAAAAADEFRDADGWWHPAWMPFGVTTGGGTLACDCRPNDAEQHSILYVDWGINPESDQPVESGFPAVVAKWVTAFERGWWRHEDGRWHLDEENAPRQDLVNGIL